MKDEKRFLRELKRTVKKAGNRKRRRYLKDVAAKAEDFSFGRDRTDVMNEKPRKKNTARTQPDQPRPTEQPIADSEPADIAGRPAPD
jgi:hypothetical protein